MSAAWTDEQIAIVRRNWRQMTDECLANLLAEHGHQKSPKSVEGLRRRLRLFKPQGSAQSKAIARRAEKNRLKGWPVVPNCPEERERRYLKALREASKLEESKRRGAA